MSNSPKLLLLFPYIEGNNLALSEAKQNCHPSIPAAIHVVPAADKIKEFFGLVTTENKTKVS